MNLPLAGIDFASAPEFEKDPSDWPDKDLFFPDCYVLMQADFFPSLPAENISAVHVRRSRQFDKEERQCSVDIIIIIKLWVH